MADWPTLLIVEDEPNLVRMLSEYFSGQGYRVRAHEWGQEALAACRADPPSLALLDIHLPDLTGYELAEQLRGHWRTRDVPVIFLTSRRARQDRLHGLELGAVDYIAKPFDLQELNLRVQNALRRHIAAGQAPYDPVTGLPEGALLDEVLAGLRDREDWAAVVVRLHNLGRFQDTYGFAAAADVRRAVGLKLRQLAEAHPGAESPGQLEPDCFCVLTMAGQAEALVRDLQAALGPSLDYFYPLEDHPEALGAAQRLSAQISLLAAGPATEPAALKRRLLAACQ
ncbi:MAG: response regulator transcription factor [Anaerolineales bacterium]|nr:response regulator transcription factor [Anaerolineales bacterium]